MNVIDATDFTAPYCGQDEGAQDSESVERLRGRRRRSRAPLGAAEKAALTADAHAADARVRALVLERRASSRAMAHELHEVKRRRLHEVFGFSSVSAYAIDREVADSPSQVKSMIKLIERLQDQPGLREVFEQDRLDWTKAREVARELERRGNTPEALEELLQDAQRLPSRELEEKYRRARGEPITRRLRLEVPEHVDAEWAQVLVAMRAERPTITPSDAFGLLVQAYLQGQAGSGGPRLVLHCAVPADAPVTPGATRAQAALDAAAASQAVIVQTPRGPVALSRARLEAALCCAQINDVRHGPERATRSVPPRKERFVRDRDQGRCRAPGCSNMSNLDVHHEGGRRVVGHDPDLMLCLCPVHHGMRHEGLLGIVPVPGGWVFAFADGSAPVFVPFDCGVAVPAPSSDDSTSRASTRGGVVERTAPPPSGEDVRPAGAIREAEEDAIKALVVLESTKRDARASVRRAVASLTSRGVTIDASSLVTEALRLAPAPVARRPR